MNSVVQFYLKAQIMIIFTPCLSVPAKKHEINLPRASAALLLSIIAKLDCSCAGV